MNIEKANELYTLKWAMNYISIQLLPPQEMLQNSPMVTTPVRALSPRLRTSGLLTGLPAATLTRSVHSQTAAGVSLRHSHVQQCSEPFGGSLMHWPLLPSPSQHQLEPLCLLRGWGCTRRTCIHTASSSLAGHRLMAPHRSLPMGPSLTTHFE